MTTKSPMDAAIDVWLDRNPGQAADADTVDLIRAVVVAVLPLIRRRAFADAAAELRSHAKEVWQTDQARSLGISDAAALLVGWAERGDTAWLDGDLDGIVARLAEARDAHPGDRLEYLRAISMIESLAEFTSRPPAWRLRRISQVIAALNRVTGADAPPTQPPA